MRNATLVDVFAIFSGIICCCGVVGGAVVFVLGIGGWLVYTFHRKSLLYGMFLERPNKNLVSIIAWVIILVLSYYEILQQNYVLSSTIRNRL